jgi:hypothetical protein
VLLGKVVAKQEPSLSGRATSRPKRGETCGVPILRPPLRAIATLPFVISTEAKRSGEICGFFFPVPTPSKSKIVRRIFQQPAIETNEDLDSIVVIGLILSYIVHSANESQLDATENNVKALRTVE